ncbi:hepatoma-derived growth factor-related protein 2 isoform X2 [Hermetia illucens]|uniref:hepatoma-derived growth factor-related protein 2 isoform X2 n=1 Tax=Hermetia illucens TaxID=343691 RepID=UPI0018CC4F06|nr:hepatoma-derived growth factor-related protein 2 isoform X2 [Hermetia illucens]
MGKKDKQFQIGDLVFAKVKGYPPWPAKITKIASKKYNVYFYGTGETANIKLEDLFGYVDSKEKFATEKNMKRNNFREAMEQIEAALNGEDSAPISMEALRQDINEVPENNEADESKIDQTSLDADDTLVTNDTLNDSAVPDVDKSTVNTTVSETPIKDTEITSRSGRKIKPKRYIDEDEPPAVRRRTTSENTPVRPSKIAKIDNNVEEQKEKVSLTEISSNTNKVDSIDKDTGVNDSKKQPPITATSTLITKPEKHKNLLLAITPDGKCVGVKLDKNKPDSFASDSDRISWQKSTAKAAFKLKEDIESGKTDIGSVREQLDLNPNVPIHQIERMKHDMGIENISQQKYLSLERTLIDMNLKIKSTVGLTKADVDKCLELLDEYRELEITPLMLKKNPHCVETMKRLRRYVGNLKEWKISDEEKLQFLEKAEKIRQKSESIYNNFKKMFTIPKGKSFWEAFTEEVEDFRERTKSLSADEKVTLIEEPIRSEPERVEADNGQNEEDQQPNSKNDEENSDSNNVTTEKLATPVETTEVN